MELIARKYIGQKEKPNNSGFYDEDFEAKMKLAGWVESWAWCAFFVILVLKEAGIKIPWSGSCVRFWEKNEDNQTSDIKNGYIVVWQRYKNGEPTRQGHIGIVTETGSNHFKSIEGNTNRQGHREGEVVREQLHGYGWWVKDGLRLVGFIKVN